MAERSNAMFNKKAMEKMKSPDDLDRYLRVSNPRFWATLIACAIFLAGFLIWGIFGRISTTVSGKGVQTDGKIHCFLTEAEAEKVVKGDKVNVNGMEMEILEISENPWSYPEAEVVLHSDYLLNLLMKETWMYHATVGGDDSMLMPKEGVVQELSIITESMAPISLIMGGED